MKKLAALSALMFLGFAGNANAATLVVNLGNVNDAYTHSIVGGFNTANTALTSPGNVTLNHNAQLITAPPYSVTNQYSMPAVGSLFGGSYLAVLGTAADPGFATFTLSAGLDHFGFSWGTIDTYNQLVITDSTNHTFTLNGTQVLNWLSIPLGQSGAAGTQTDISFFDPFGSIKSAVFKTPKNSFEVANFFSSDSPVPLPPSFVLFMTALLSLGGYGMYRRRTQKF